MFPDIPLRFRNPAHVCFFIATLSYMDVESHTSRTFVHVSDLPLWRNLSEDLTVTLTS